MEHQLENLVESAMIFGLPAPTRVELDSCRNEIKLIKVHNISVHDLECSNLKSIDAS